MLINKKIEADTIIRQSRLAVQKSQGNSLMAV